MLDQNRQYTVEELRAEFDRVNNRNIDHKTRFTMWGVIFDALVNNGEDRAIAIMDGWIAEWMKTNQEAE